ncbi:hypothetical protein LEP1GSC058_4008 [Leptospira fainei serovar Hurstbridge str. BUT 6]|uniref:DUF5777 domain-containing protein n=1 Tax=Leptospira fainei serovar Hurstbridge str. BUT 6 TaxID=1193011 RepID=S3US56_9LEPT|nr:DUF5777 family beta-barrel protein [Leptospira fainei]EPG73236.1 hypothetical protein LEP1GSC058_4008 [Leptospira fainei serovar Hurstbridge str. BUT 6]
MKKNYFTILLFLISSSLFGEGSAFMSPTLINMPSTENVGYRNLDLRFNHRFGDAQNGFKDLFGLDSGANILIGADYGLTKAISVGAARISENKTYELRSKIRLLSQSSILPFTMSLWGVASQDTDKEIIPLNPTVQPPSTGISILDANISQNVNHYTLTDNDKRSYMASILISRKFNKYFSLQLSPTFVHRNFVKSTLRNDRFGVDVGGRLKLFKRVDFTFEAIFTRQRDYIGTDYTSASRQTALQGVQTLTATDINTLYVLPRDLPAVYFQNIVIHKHVPHYTVPFSFGVDFETGGHVFQLFITDIRALAQTKLLNGGDFDFGKRQYSIGFNIHRSFSFEEESKPNEWEETKTDSSTPVGHSSEHQQESTKESEKK